MCASLETAVATSLEIIGGPKLAQGSGIVLLVPAALCFGGRAVVFASLLHQHCEKFWERLG